MKIAPTLLTLATVATLANPLSVQAAQLSESREQLAKAIVEQHHKPLTPAERGEMDLNEQEEFDQELFRLTLIYQAAFKQGVQAGIKNQWQFNTEDEVALVGYQAGFDLGKELQKKAESTSDQATKGKTDQPVTETEDTIPTPPERVPTEQPVENVDDSMETSTAPGNNLGQDDETNYPAQAPTPSQRAFIEKLAPVAQEIAAGHDLYPSVLIAQAALESNFGSSDLARQHHNYFGIKGFFQSQGVSMPTIEHLNGQDLTVMGTFRHYPNDMASLNDYASVLNQPLYVNVHRKFASTYRQATQALTGTYAIITRS